MFEYWVVVIATIIVSILTFFSGFGLGTLLLPVFIIFFPIDIAVAATALVHLANNVFKGILVGRKADLGIVLKFSLPGAIFAVIGALLLEKAVVIPAIYHYQAWGHTFAVTPVKLLAAFIMAVFCLIELLPSMKDLAFSTKFVPLGGALSGFFGGLTGHQGALRAAFLVRLGLDKETFVGTTILSAIVIDCARLLIYGTAIFVQDISLLQEQKQFGVIVAGIMAAFLGAVLGYLFIKKSSLEFIHKIIGVLLMFYSLLLGAGII